MKSLTGKKKLTEVSYISNKEIQEQEEQQKEEEKEEEEEETSTMIASHLLAYYVTELHHDQAQKVSGSAVSTTN